MNQPNFARAMPIVAILVGSTSFAAGPADPRSPDGLKKILEAPPLDPKEHSKAALTKIYMERGRAGSMLGDLDRELKELDAGIQALGAKDPNSYEFYHRRAQLHLDRGDDIGGRGATPSAANSFIGFGDPVFGTGARSSAPVASRGMVRRNAKAPAAPIKSTSNLELL